MLKSKAVRLIALAVLIEVGSGSNSAEAVQLPTLVRCQALKSNVTAFPAEYVRDVCEAERLWGGGKKDESVAKYETADRKFLHEYPNFELLPTLASAYCRTGKRSAGLAALNVFQCAMNVYAGDVKCFSPGVGADGGLLLNDSIDRDCSARMCGEAFESYYGPKARDEELRMAKFKKVFRSAVQICGGR